MPIIESIKKHLGLSPRKSEKTRQTTLQPWVSRSEAGRETPNEISTPPSLTTSSSVTERSSEPAEDAVPVNDHIAASTLLSDGSEETKETQPSHVTVLQPPPTEEGRLPSEEQMPVDTDMHLEPCAEQDELPSEEGTSAHHAAASQPTAGDETLSSDDEMAVDHEMDLQQDKLPLEEGTSADHVAASQPTAEEESLLSDDDMAVDADVDTMLSGEAATIDAEGDLEHDMLRDSLEGLNPAWELDAMPGDDLDLSDQDDSDEQSQSSSPGQPNMLTQATQAITKKIFSTKSRLGKRKRREPGTAHSEQKDTSKSKRSSLRSCEIKSTNVDDEPTSKRLRKSELALTTSVSSSTSTRRPKDRKKPQKIWLKQGLYVGQDPDFDPRLTESKNKKKKEKMAPQSSGAKKVNSLLPPPMFAGQRLLDRGRDFRLPFDVHSPLPPGQPKPDDWKKTSKSK